MLQAVTWDAVVAGGGPAGAAFALELARHGRRVVLLERSKAASHKVCGEFLSPETGKLLAYLGIDAAACGATAIDQFRLVSGERRAEIQLPFRAQALSRHLLDEALLQGGCATRRRSGAGRARFEHRHRRRCQYSAR